MLLFSIAWYFSKAVISWVAGVDCLRTLIVFLQPVLGN